MRVFSPRKLEVRKVAVLLIVAWAVCGCRARTGALGTLALSSPELAGGRVAQAVSCKGAGNSPSLKWSAPPAGTVSLTLIVTDPDAPDGTFTHWLLYDLPPELRELPAGIPRAELLPDSSSQGRNDFSEIGYGAPCPPGKASHRYVFTLYALNERLNLPAGATRVQVEKAMKGHTLAQGKLIALLP